MNGALLPLAAVAAGIVSASSPCVLPVLPGYLAAVSSTDRGGLDGQPRPSIRGAIGFVVGFTIVFTALGATASAVGAMLYAQLDNALKVAGLMLIILGLSTLGVVPLRFLSFERRPVDMHRIAGGPRRSVLLGAVFGLGWTPCIGPILATVLTKAAADSSLTEGMVLLLLYSAGLGVPFIALAFWFDRSARIRRWLTRHTHTIERIGGIAMIIIGLGYLTGIWSTIFTGIQGWLARTGWPPI